MTYISELIDAIENGQHSVDVLAAIIPAMVKERHRSLPDVLAYTITKKLWQRWGYEGPWEYFEAIHVPESVRQQAEAVLLECAAENPAYAPGMGPDAVRLIGVLVADGAGRLTPREFHRRIAVINAAVDRHQCTV